MTIQKQEQIIDILAIMMIISLTLMVAIFIIGATHELNIKP